MVYPQKSFNLSSKYLVSVKRRMSSSFPEFQLSEKAWDLNSYEALGLMLVIKPVRWCHSSIPEILFNKGNVS